MQSRMISPDRLLDKHKVLCGNALEPEAAGSQNMILFVDDRRDVQILMRVHAPDDVARASFDAIHSSLQLRPLTNGFAETECADRTVTRP